MLLIISQDILGVLTCEIQLTCARRQPTEAASHCCWAYLPIYQPSFQLSAPSYLVSPTSRRHYRPRPYLVRLHHVVGVSSMHILVAGVVHRKGGRVSFNGGVRP